MHLGEDAERIFGISSQILDGIDISIATERSTVRSAIVFVTAPVCFTGTFPHHGFSDDEGGLSFYLLGLVERTAYSIGIVTVDSNDVPIPCLVFLGDIFTGYGIGSRRELYVVGVVEHDEVVETEVSCQTAGTLRNLFLHTAVGNIGIDRLIHDIAQTRFQKLGGDSSPHSIGMSLSQRTRSVFDTAHDIYFGVPRRGAVPLAEPA